MVAIGVADVGLWVQAGLRVVSSLVADMRERPSLHARRLLENHGNNGAWILV